MALRIDASAEHAYLANPWSSGPITIAFWMYRLNSAATTRFLCGFLDTDDALPESGGDPRVSVGTNSTNTIIGTYTGAGASSNDSTGTYSSAGQWDHVAVVFDGSGTAMTSVEVFVNGTGSGSPGTGSRDLSTNGTFDRLQIGSATANHSNVDIAHFAYYNAALFGPQITELQTKLPNAITGATPDVYEDFLVDEGTFTLSSATIDATNDAALPALSGGSSTPIPRSMLLGVG